MSSQKKEKLLIENLLSSREVFSRCFSILKAEYFEQPEYRPAVTFLNEYFLKYKGLPEFDVVNAEFDLDFKRRDITTDLYNYTCDEVEKHCKQAAFVNAVRDSFEMIEKHELAQAYKKMTDAMQVSLQKDLGIDLYDDPEEYMKSLLITQINHSTLIKCIDEKLAGGLARQTFTLISANSGVGKSNMLANLGANYSMQGFNVLYISLELPQDMIYLRLAAIETDTHIAKWREKIPQIAGNLLNKKQSGAGSYRINRLPGGTTANDIRSYLRHYEMTYKCRPDVIIVDYLDLMYPNGGIKNKGVFEQDKEKAEEVTELLVEYNAIGLSASQQNREALRMAAPDQAVIAGGISKVNTVHNYISLVMNAEMAVRGDMVAWFLKTRTSNGKGESVMLNFDVNTLRITDSGKDPTKSVPNIVKTSKWGNANSPMSKKLSDIIANNSGGGMPKAPTPPPSEEDEDRIFRETMDEKGNVTMEEIDIVYDEPMDKDVVKAKITNDPLLSLMSQFGDM
jgi:archaellum biogenesis ATPase FlaH